LSRAVATVRIAAVFSIDDVAWFLGEARDAGTEVWLDGGWGVDALLGRQTRVHQDLDIALRTDDAPALVAALQSHGFTEVDLEHRRPFNFVYGHDDGRRVDFHLFDLDADGNGQYGDDGAVYSALALSGRGELGGRRVRCIEASTLVGFHTGYAHDDDDAHDVHLLCRAFGIALPDQYR